MAKVFGRFRVLGMTAGFEGGEAWSWQGFEAVFIK